MAFNRTPAYGMVSAARVRAFFLPGAGGRAPVNLIVQRYQSRT
jgi:hypothetical protein